LYHLLIKPLPLSSNINQLVIVPDGILSLIPFESLVTEPVKGKERGYENLKYLIQKYAISYSYSATLYEESLHKVVSQAKNEYIGFAPVFSNESKAGYVAKSHAIFLSDSAGTTRGLIDRNNITAIPGTKDEVIAILDGFNKKEKKATVYTYQKANEDNMKKEKLSDYKYIHFATHGFVNEDQPALSGIILAQDTSIIEDGVLYAGEVYGLQLDAESVILSACETGLGKQVRGEGIIGLTRGFLYAGARSVVVSLWQVADESTSKLMQDMFKRLSEDKNSYDHRAKLLRETKLRMIKEKQYAPPFYWSPFILIGK
jgi:CHAT domain-containing protein